MSLNVRTPRLIDGASTSVAFTSNGTVDFKVDAGPWASAGSSPLVINRNVAGGAAKTVQIRATMNGQTNTQVLSVDPQVASPPSRAFVDVDAYVSHYGKDEVTVEWTPTGFVAGDYFRVMKRRNGSAYSQLATNVTASFVVDTTILDDLEPSGAGPDVTFDYYVEWYNNANALQLTSSVATVVSDTA